MARVVELVVAIGWAAFWLYWLVAALSRKRGRVPWSRELGIRAVIAVVVSGLGRLLYRRGQPRSAMFWQIGGAVDTTAPARASADSAPGRARAVYLGLCPV